MHIPCPIKLDGIPDGHENDLAHAIYTRILAQGLLTLNQHWNRNNLQYATRYRHQASVASRPQARHTDQHRQQQNEPERQKAKGRSILLQGQQSKLQRLKNWLRVRGREGVKSAAVAAAQPPMLAAVQSTAGDGPLI